LTRVLVIDDEAPIRLLCRVNLEAEGMEVLEATKARPGSRRHGARDPT
jgi:DNA-binding response OmpR family regulator